jgi:rSAM/selenodomain-associated transferase 1
VKTRLAARLTEPGALRLYRAFLEDASRTYGRGEWSPVVAVEPDAEDPAIVPFFPPPWRRERQPEGDLGARLTWAFEREFARGAPAAVAIGSDHPALAHALVAEALALVRHQPAAAAVIPAEDGGYCAIALSSGAPFADAFRDVPWSTDRVLDVTRARLAERGIPLAILAGGYDVDRPEDVDRLRRDLAGRDPDAPDFPRATALALADLP